jgi:dihydrofolate reductase
MKISMIVGMGNGREIGLAGRLLWHLREDLQHFKTLTMGHHILMGRKTYQSIGRPLPGRHTIVLTRDPSFLAEGCRVERDFLAAIDFARKQGESELFIVGGGEIYQMALPSTERIHLSLIEYSGPADTYFPIFEQSGTWQLVKDESRGAGVAGLSWRYQLWERSL